MRPQHRTNLDYTMTMMRRLFLLLSLVSCSLAQTGAPEEPAATSGPETVAAAPPAQTVFGTMKDIMETFSELTLFRESLVAAGLFESPIGDKTKNLTVFAPTNLAIEATPLWMTYLKDKRAWHVNLEKTVRNHMIEETRLPIDGVFNNSELETSTGKLFVFPGTSGKPGRIETATIVQTLEATNGWLYIVDATLKPRFFEYTLQYLEEMPEFGPDQEENRIALTDVVDFLDVRYKYDQPGITNVGCRLRAFNRMSDYLIQTINQNELGNVKFGEMLNKSFINETIYNFIEYSIIPQIYYKDDYQHGYEELRMSANGCAHMWVTKQKNEICFNNACSIYAAPAFTPLGTPEEERIQYASNGVGYVVDKCIVCPGIGMLVEYTFEYTKHNMKDVAQFFRSSEWNLRNLSLSIGDGGPLTLFAAVNTGWFEVTGEDVIRLSTDMWKPHQWDFLKGMVIQGNYTEAELRQIVSENGGKYNFTTLANQTLEMEIDTGRDVLMVAGGDLYFNDVKGVDGMLHFITRVPLVRSITHSVYEIGDWLGRYYEQLNLIDSVFLDDDMKRLEPMTAVYAPDSEWRNKKIELDNIEYILESHLFEALLWCDVLLEYAPGSGHENEGKKIESLSGAEWSITKNGLGMPCFTIFIGLGEQLASCVTECDVLARNGIVHTVDKVMLDTPVATRGPSPSLPPIERPPRDVYNNNGRPSGQTGQGSNGYLDGETDVSYSRPKRLYGWDEVDTDATSSAKRQGVVLAALLPLLLTLQ